MSSKPGRRPQGLQDQFVRRAPLTHIVERVGPGEVDAAAFSRHAGVGAARSRGLL